MLPQLRHMNVLPLGCCLLIALGVSLSASQEQANSQWDTRNIPTDMFKPLNSAKKPTATNSTYDAFDDDDSLTQLSTGKATSVTFANSPDEELTNPVNHVWSRPRFSNQNPVSFPNQNSGNFYSGYQQSNPRVNQQGSFGRNPIPFPITWNNNGGNGVGYIGTSYSSVPLSTPMRFGPLINGLSRTSNIGIPHGESSNFYRSEHYSYSSDGVNAPQIQRSVYDSRLGDGYTTRNF